MKKSLISILLLSFLTGCASTRIPDKDPEEYQYERIEARILDEWELDEIPITYIDADVSFGIERRNEVPESIRDIKIDGLNIPNGESLSILKDLLKVYGVNLFIPDGELASTEFSIRNFNGTVGDLFDVIEKGYNLSFNHTGVNNVILRDFSLFTAPIPQDEESANDLVGTLESLGAEGTNHSLAGGFVIYKASHDNQDGIKEYLNSYYKNFAVIKLQVAVITVNLDRETNTGFDWSSLQAVIGNADLIDLATDVASGGVASGIGGLAGTPSPNNDGNNNGNDDGNGDDDGDSDDNGGGDNGSADASGRALGLTSNQLQGRYKRGNKDIQAAFNLLNTYGVSNATQSIFLETISGKELKLRSGKEVPYTSNINQNITGGNNQNVSSLSGFQAERESEGLEVTFQPYFNYKKNTVTLGLDLNLKTIVGFQEINSGNSNGSVEQPITQEQEFNSVVEIRPGEAHLVGGITFTLDSDNRNNLNFLGDLPTASQRRKSNQNALFILLRPTVSIYGKEFDKED